jgi:SpoVK/Ycf46/Vps4 family AAA+-type ATPase
MVPRYRWEDIVLPEDTLNQLKEICNCIQLKTTVFGEWGFDKKLSLGRGLNILFAGPSGTGKTMSAEIIAYELGLDIYRIDLSKILSKYIGETERAISKVFAELACSNSIVFFDEADSLCGRRTDLKSSHDRYANIEVNHLLQKIEEHEGIVILSSNLRANIDDAFTRRLNYIVEFPFPEEIYRKRIWQRVYPPETPLSDNLDFDFLSHRFKIAGGNIKNIALNSAFLAAADGGIVCMEHVILATKREFQKMGKICSRSDYGQYWTLVTDESD